MEFDSPDKVPVCTVLEDETVGLIRIQLIETQDGKYGMLRTVDGEFEHGLLWDDVTDQDTAQANFWDVHGSLPGDSSEDEQGGNTMATEDPTTLKLRALHDRLDNCRQGMTLTYNAQEKARKVDDREGVTFWYDRWVDWAEGVKEITAELRTMGTLGIITAMTTTDLTALAPAVHDLAVECDRTGDHGAAATYRDLRNYAQMLLSLRGK